MGADTVGLGRQPNCTTRTGFEKRLAIYMLAGGAILAAPVASRAGTISYSGIQNIVVTGPGSYDLDLNADLITDFTLSAQIGDDFGKVSVTPSADNSVATDGSFKVTAFQPSDQINLAAGNWKRHSAFNMVSVRYNKSSSKSTTVGNWDPDGTPAYLGLRFVISGNTHYGWAQVATNVSSASSRFQLIDWAYEIRPDTGIHVGDTVGEVPEPSTLSLFALGAAGLLAWRRRKGTAKS